MKTALRILLVLGVALGSIGCDQATKAIATASLRGRPAELLLGGAVRLQYAENRGAFLSLGAQLPESARFWLLTVGVGLLLVALGAAALRRGLSATEAVALALFAGGGLSNWVDRLRSGGSVVDFLNIGIGSLRTGIFNVADLAIVGGVVLLLWRRRLG
jgi:signal peptidase II